MILPATASLAEAVIVPKIPQKYDIILFYAGPDRRGGCGEQSGDILSSQSASPPLLER